MRKANCAASTKLRAAQYSDWIAPSSWIGLDFKQGAIDGGIIRTQYAVRYNVSLKLESFLGEIVKRKAILIGNTRNLEGVQIDIDKTRRFLCSPIGGAWYSNEIEILENPGKAQLLNQLKVAKQQSFDFAFVLFSGHGAHKRQTVLEINGYGETITESDLLEIAPRQVSIFDCCRGVIQESVRKSVALDSLSASFSESSVRYRYDNRVMQALPQQVRLYSCAVGESSYDTANGAIYLGHLMDAAKALEYGNEFKTVETAHAEARANTIRSRTGGSQQQTPEATLPKCITSQQLIISLRP